MPVLLSRLAAVTLLITVLLASWSSMLSALNWHAEQQDALARDQALLERYRQVVATEGVWRQRLEGLSARIEQDGLYLPGKKSAQAAVQLQERIKKLIRAEDGQIRTVRSKALEGDEHAGVAVDVQAKLTPAGLLGVFKALEGGAPLLVIDRLQLRKDRADDRLLATFSVRGFVKASL